MSHGSANLAANATEQNPSRQADRLNSLRPRRKPFCARLGQGLCAPEASKPRAGRPSRSDGRPKTTRQRSAKKRKETERRASPLCSVRLCPWHQKQLDVCVCVSRLGDPHGIRMGCRFFTDSLNIAYRSANQTPRGVRGVRCAAKERVHRSKLSETSAETKMRS